MGKGEIPPVSLLLLQGMGSRLDPPASRPPKFHGVFRGCERFVAYKNEGCFL